MSGVKTLLIQMSAAGRELLAIGEVEEASPKLAVVQGIAVEHSHLAEARKLPKDYSIHLWSTLQQEKIVLADVARAFGAVMTLAPRSHALRAAAVYTSLLMAPGCPVLSLFDRVVCSSFLRLLRETATAQLPKGGKKPSGKAAPTVEDPFAADAGSDDDVMDLDAAPSTTQAADALSSAQSEAELLPLCARNFAAILSAMSLKDQPDTARQVAEAFADVAAMTALPQSVTDASYAVLKALLAPVHGSTRELSAAVFRLLAPHLLGTAAASGPAAGKAARAKESRAAALEFVRAAVKEHPGCEEAAAALMRHLALHGPDKADGRSAAVECAVELCFMLGSGHLRNFVGFVARLSRTAKVPQRVMAVDLAHGLLESLGAEFGAFHVLSSRGIDSGAGGLLAAGGPHPLVPPAIAALRRASGPGRSGSERGTPAGRSTASGTGTLAGTPSTLVGTPASWTGIGPGGEPLTAAPWGVVCLAVLVQRGSDRAPAVRSRALSHLAAVVAAHAGDVPLEAEADMDVTGHTSSSRGSRASPTSVSFRAAVAAALQVNLQQPSPTEGPIPGLSPARGSPAGSDASGASPMAVDENTPSQAPGTANTSSALTSTGAKSSHRPSSAAPALPGAATFPVPCALIAAGDAADLMPLLRTARRRCRDEKGPARKGGVQLLQALILLRASGDCPALPSAQELAAFETAAADPLVTVRKAALVAVAALANVLPREADAGALWVAACLPLVRDPEASVLDTLLDQFQDMVLDKAATCAQGKEPGPAAVAAAAKLRPLLAAASQGGAAGKACLARACAQLKSKGRLQAKKAAAGLERIISGLGRTPEGSATTLAEEESGAWLMFAELATQDASAPSWQFLDAQWSSLSSTDSNDKPHAPQLLRVISMAAAGFPADRAAALCAQLRHELDSLTLPHGVAAAHIAALAQLTATHGGDMPAWTSATLSSCEAVLFKYIDDARHGLSPDSGSAAATSGLFVTGEVALLKAAKPTQRLVTLVQALTSPALALEAALSSFSQPMPPSESNERGQLTSGSASVAPVVQAHAWVTLGKLCLADEALAKKCVPLFVQELGRAASPAVRNNIMVALADLVINYTALVDSHIPRLAACLRDPNELVRTQALGLLANLLQKDYVKWRGPLFHRFLLALIDESPRVAAMAEYLLSDTLATKVPNLAYNHFVEALFVLNDCQVGLAGGAAAAAGVADLTQGGGVFAGKGAFTLQGSDEGTRAKRDAIYTAMLRRMSPEHKFATAARLCQEILGGAADGALPLSECSEVVRDALRVLASKNIKVSVRGGTGDADIDAGESDPAAAMGAAKGKLVSQMMKKHLAEAVVPVVIELKQAMEQSRHPLLGDLMAAAAAMLKDHKSEIENILAADRQLAKEILYDIRQAEAAEAARAAEAAAEAAEARRQRAMAATAKTPAAGRAPSSNGAAPWSSGGRRPRSTPRPAGTNGSTPMAAEVLRTASKTNLPSGGSRLGLAAAAVSSGTTPPAVGGGTPGTGVLTPGSRLPRTQGAHRGAVSRLARASGPGAAGPQAATGAALGATPAVPRSAGGGVSPAVPMLRGASKTPGTGPAKLRGTPSALNGGHAVGKGGAVVDEDDDEAHVELNFAVPEPGGGAVEAQWNVSPAVVPPPVEDGVGAAGEMEAARENDGEKSERLSDGAEGDCPEAVEKGGGIEAGGSIAGTGVRRSARGRGGGAAGARKRKA